MGIEISVFYFFIVCALTACEIGLVISVISSERPRLSGLYSFGILLLYLVVMQFCVSVWGDVMNKWYGQWPAFTLGIIIGIPSLVVICCTTILSFYLLFNSVVLGKVPVWVSRIQANSIWRRVFIGLCYVLVFSVLGGFVLSFVLR